MLGEVPAGSVFEGVVGAGQCVRIMTGAPVPEGLDAVVKYEIVQIVAGSGMTDGRVAFFEPAKVGANIREAGEEAKAGQVIVHAGEPIGTAGIGFLAGCGVLEVPVYAKPRVAVMAIGSELVEPTELPGPGHIRNSNSTPWLHAPRRQDALPALCPL